MEGFSSEHSHRPKTDGTDGDVHAATKQQPLQSGDTHEANGFISAQRGTAEAKACMWMHGLSQTRGLSTDCSLKTFAQTHCMCDVMESLPKPRGSAPPDLITDGSVALTSKTSINQAASSLASKRYAHTLLNPRVLSLSHTHSNMAASISWFLEAFHVCSVQRGASGEV